ncbi:MAG: bifunctional UDP-N-acetylglucosamine diphosphorylase/glucosamine-1-phosphate N-acetyltransferase GlmU [Halothiobacillaceae bacterium]
MLKVVILAAGRGTRMRSARPKVLHPLAGRPLLAHVIETARALSPAQIRVVIGHEGAQVQAALGADDLSWYWQHGQRGTGHAVQQALAGIGAGDRVLVLYGDVPLIRALTLRDLLESAANGPLALLTAVLDDPAGYGRILRDADGAVLAIREHKDATAAERTVREVNTGIMVVEGEALCRWLGRLDSDNAQGELYLTDIVEMAVAEGVDVGSVTVHDTREIAGVNTRAQLAALERVAQSREADWLMAQGVSLADPARIDVRGHLTVGEDIFVDVNCVFEGDVRLGDGVQIGPGCVISDCEIGPGTRVLAHSVLEGARIAAGVQVGPFARLRPGTELGCGSRVGNFVEIKQAQIGPGSKINHLSYVGDARVGRNVNIGAGTITCNYDGANKHLTEIGDEVFVGSDSQLVAPVRIGDGATIGAGSTITQDVSPGTLALARSRQTERPDWKRPVRKVRNGQ